MKLLAVLEATTGHFARHGLTSPRLQAELLIAHVLSLPRLGLYLQFERELNPAELDSLRTMVRQDDRLLATLFSRLETKRISSLSE
jgi:release factor glutamine methyltransferase